MKRTLLAAMVMVSSQTAHADARWHAREMKPTSDAVGSVAPFEPPSAARPEGTIAVSAGWSTMEVDVARRAIVSRASFPCAVLHRISGVLLGSCDGDLVAFGSGLGVSWRAHWPTNVQLAPKDIFANGTRVVATFASGFNLVVRVATTNGVVVSEVDTKALLVDGRARASVFVHGSTVIAFAFHYAQAKNTLLALSPDGQHVAATREVPALEAAWDDGVHVHVSSGAEDVTLDDALRPVHVGAKTMPASGTSAFPITQADGPIHGTGVFEEFDLGPNHFWFTFGCCGDQGGLFVAKVR
jgi:hypothetical protein